MSRLKLITKYFVKNALSEMFASSKMHPAVIVTLMIFIVSLISLPFTIMIGEGYESFHSMGQEGVLLAILLSVGATVAFFFGIYTIMNVFYFSDDIEVILPLPFKSSEIVFGKFVAVLINMYIYINVSFTTYSIWNCFECKYYVLFVCSNCTYDNTYTSNDISCINMHGTYEIY